MDAYDRIADILNSGLVKKLVEQDEEFKRTFNPNEYIEIFRVPEPIMNLGELHGVYEGKSVPVKILDTKHVNHSVIKMKSLMEYVEKEEKKDHHCKFACIDAVTKRIKELEADDKY